jgi:hypothetical protein
LSRRRELSLRREGRCVERKGPRWIGFERLGRRVRRQQAQGRVAEEQAASKDEGDGQGGTLGTHGVRAPGLGVSCTPQAFFKPADSGRADILPREIPRQLDVQVQDLDKESNAVALVLVRSCTQLHCDQVLRRCDRHGSRC